jgi:hypothetical protein
MTRVAIVHLHKAVFVVVAVLAISLVMHIPLIILAKVISIIPTAQAEKIIEGNSTV